MKILNLYACLGGNRFLWGDEHEITAVELDPELCRMYQERFPNDTVINGDAHKYLLNNFQKFDFIWSSPPCPTHSRARFWFSSNENTATEPVYPDMKLYQEIILLDNYFSGRYCVENVIPYYKPLIPGKKRGRHIFWTNFNLPASLNEIEELIGIIRSKPAQERNKLCGIHGIDLSDYKGNQRKDQLARNLVDYEVGKTILDVAMNCYSKKTNQTSLF